MQNKKTNLIDAEETILDLNSPISTHLNAMSPAEWRAQALGEYLNCVLCGNEFTFVQKTDFAQLQVEEEAHCEFCKIRGSKNSHILQ